MVRKAHHLNHPIELLGWSARSLSGTFELCFMDMTSRNYITVQSRTSCELSMHKIILTNSHLFINWGG